MPPAEGCLGIDLGGSSVKAVAIAADGTEVTRLNEPFDPDQRMAWAELIQRIIADLRPKAADTSYLGVSAPGLASLDGLKIACMPGRLDGLTGLVWEKYLEWPRAVPVINDAHAALLGEWYAGAAQNLQNVCMLTLGTGVGGAAIVDGELLRGHIGRGGHLGHVTVEIDGPMDVTATPGSIEWAIGNYSIKERSQGRFETTHALIEAYAAGDSFAKQTWLRSVRLLACAMNSIINVLDPEVFIIGGGVARAGNSLFEPLAKYLAEFEWKPLGSGVRVVPAALGEFAGAIGVAHYARARVGLKR